MEKERIKTVYTQYEAKGGYFVLAIDRRVNIVGWSFTDSLEEARSKVERYKEHEEMYEIAIAKFVEIIALRNLFELL